MSIPITVRTGPQSHELRIRAVFGNELRNKIQDAVAWRAYRFFEEQDCVPGHDVEHWHHAYAETVRSLDCGVLVQDRRVCLTADASMFDVGPLEIYIEPRRITLCGFGRSIRPLPTPPGEPARPRRDWVFRVHDFDVDVDPRAVVARFNGPVLNVYLGRVVAPPERSWVAAAAG